MTEQEKQKKVVSEKGVTGFFYTGKPLTDLFMETGRGELVSKDGAVWSSRAPADIPLAGNSEHEVNLTTDAGEKVVDLNVLYVLVRNGASFEALRDRFQAEGASRKDAILKVCHEYPVAHGDYLEAETIRQMKQEQERRSH